MHTDKIVVKGAREHNLKNISVEIPKNKLVVFTGLSGSGKSSMAHDTIYAEGQRKYVESLSTYARQFLGIMDKPDVDIIEGLSPAISIDQKASSNNPRSTVGTVTEIYDYIRLLFARVGHPYCPVCGREVKKQTVDQMADGIFDIINDILKVKHIARIMLFSPLAVDKKGEFSSLFSNLTSKGYGKVRVDGTVKKLPQDFLLIKTNKHTIEVLIDQMSISKKELKDSVAKSTIRSRLIGSIEQALALSGGLITLAEVKDAGFQFPEFPRNFDNFLFSEKFACPVDNIQIAEIEPRNFSFNSPQGACPTCSGIGKILSVDKDLVFAKSISITEGGILPFAKIFENDTWYSRLILEVCRQKGIDPKAPISQLDERQLDLLLKGTGNYMYRVAGTNKEGKMTQIYEPFAGIVPELERRYRETTSDWVRFEIQKYMIEKTCPECNGARLKKESLAVKIQGKAVNEVAALTVANMHEWVTDLENKDILTVKEKEIGKLVLQEISSRLSFLISVGLEYLTIDRSSATLSSGEAQRIRLARQLGTGLSGVLYVLDEPTVGLHQRDNLKLIGTLQKLRDIGNSVLVVEHDYEMITSADYVLDFGPGAGKEGGYIVAKGTPQELKQNQKSLTAKYLSNKKVIKFKSEFAKKDEKMLKIYGASEHNLKGIDVFLPLGKLVVITGVSGSGKSTLLIDTLYPAISNFLNPHSRLTPGTFERLEGAENIGKVILIDQTPIGRTPRSNPATYTKVFTPIRELYAETRQSKILGFNKSRFSFNVKKGRCEACQGQGQNKIEMQFMSDIWVTCEVCKGTRYNAQTLEVEYNGKNISDALSLTISESREFFHNRPQITHILDTLIAVGLGYMELGQSATTLSGGEAQRIKLAAELSKRVTGDTLYILDEPSVGLHFADLEKLLFILKSLVAKGNSVILIEHNLDIIKNADWIIDLGPEGGDKGGSVVTEGTLEVVKRSQSSYTGKYV